MSGHGDSAARTPDEVLADLGAALRRARPQRRRRLARGAALTVTICAALVPAALAVLPGAPPDLTRPTGAKRPDAVGRPATVVTGPQYRLIATRCRFGGHALLALRLEVPGAAAGRRCDALTPAAVHGPVAPPIQLVDVAHGRSLVFGAVPTGTTLVRVQLVRRATGARVINGVFVATTRATDRLVGTVGFAADGTPTVRCDPEECA